MRNLKKLLALVLAMVMTFSLMLSASAVDFDDYTDKDSITAEFDESVRVLTGLAVMQGDEKGFRPSDKITRAEAAAVIYRAVTGDVTDRQTDLYKDYSTFTDVKSDDWFAGYVGYCQNAGYIKGTSPTTFNPYGQVTGYEVLAMILRATGYGKNNEFTGSSWQVNVAALSKQLGVTRNVVAAHMDQTLNMAAPREVVADLVFMTIATVPMVTYTPALAYNDKQATVSTVFNPTLGQQTFGLFYNTTWQVIDDWGRPGYNWYKNGVWTGTSNAFTATQVTGANDGKAYVTPANHPIYTPPTGGWTNAQWEDNTVATIAVAPSYETKVQVRECDVAHELEIETEDTFSLFVNGVNGNDSASDVTGFNNAINKDYRIVATDTVTRVGGQGRVTEFYYEITSPWFINEANVAVMIDTMLAQVTGKTDAKLDKNNHVIVPAQLEVTIWDGKLAGPNAITTGAYATDTASKRVIQKATTDSTNWDDYSRGDFILLNAWTNKSARVTNEDRDKAAFETDQVVGSDAASTSVLTIDERVWIVDNGKNGIADHFNGKQSVIYWNQGKHQVDGKDYDDQLCLFMDKAGTNVNTTYTWYLDQFGNLIGIGDATASNFGVITSVYAAISQGDTDTTGGVKAIASVTYADGTKGTVEIDNFLVSRNAQALGTGTNGVIAATTNFYQAVPGTALSETANTIELLPVYDEAGHPAMSVGPVTTSTGTTSTEAAARGWLYMAPSSSTNTNNHFGNSTNQWDKFGILYDTMFEFVSASDNTVTAVAVSGAYAVPGAGYTNQANSNYSNKASGVANVDDSTDAANNAKYRGKVYKNLAYMALNTPTLTDWPLLADADRADINETSQIGATAYLDNNTQILLRTGSNRRTLTAYTLDTLPGDITMASGAVAQWADVDGDNRIDYLYVEGAVPGTVTYNLFYFNGGATQWDGSKGTIAGYLDGKENTINFNSLSLFNAINGSAGSYDGHLFALQITNDVVTAVMRTDAGKDGALNDVDSRDWTNRILDTCNTGAHTWSSLSGGLIGNFANNLITGATFAGGPPTTSVTADGTKFVLGSAGGNSYTANTEAVFYHDSTELDNATTHHTNLRYERVANGYQIVASGWNLATNAAIAGSETYWISPNAEIVGTLEWLNQNLECDVTIVYENGTANAATQVYITPDPDVTPVPDGGNTDPTLPVPVATGIAGYIVEDANGTVSTEYYGVPFNVYSTSSDALTAANRGLAGEINVRMINSSRNAQIAIRNNNAARAVITDSAGANTGAVYTTLNASPSLAAATALTIVPTSRIIVNTGDQGYFMVYGTFATAGGSAVGYAIIHVTTTVA